MPYIALTIVVDGQDAERWSDALMEAGALAVDASDPDAGTDAEQAVYAEPGVDAGRSWKRARLVALVWHEVNANIVLADAAAAIADAPPAFDLRPIAEADWIRESQAQFEPIHVGDRLHIVPTWHRAPDSGIVVRLDPGLAFGTGSHATTRLCLEWLLATLRGGESLLDYGCGSGILSIVAVMLGAAPVVGTDVEKQAIETSIANASQNGVDVGYVTPDALPGEPFDVVVANILANPLILLAPAIAARVRTGGRLALSGILETQADDVVTAYAPWFTLRASAAADGWVLLEGVRHAR